jgi:SNF2 family DNA or RNA helicase
MSEKFIPREYQKIAIDWIKTHPRCALFLLPGLGKTSSVLSTLDEFPVLVVAPLRVAQTTWPDEIRKWDQFKDLTYSVVIGSRDKREAALNKKAHVYTINYENLIWLIDYYGSKWPFKTIVCDEQTRLKGFRLRQGAKQAKALAKVAHSTKRFIGLTGTPSPNNLTDLWGQMWFLDKGERLGRTFSIFTEKYFNLGYDGFSLEPKEGAANAIQNAISDLCLSIDPRKYFPTDLPIVSTVAVELPQNARIKYNEMLKEMYTEINDVGIEAFNAASKTIKCLQISSGAIYTEDGYEVLHDEKLKALEEIIEGTASPILVSYQFKSDLERLIKYFPKGRVLDKDPQVIEDWNKGKIDLLFAHPASAGHGISLQHGGNVLVYFSHGWNLEHHQQILERIGPARQKQSGYDRPVYVYSIVGKDTIEADVIERLQGKATQQEILLRFLDRAKKLS